MATSQHGHRLDGDLDILGQQPGLNLYTQLALIYPMPGSTEEDNRTSIIRCLQNGLEKLTEAFPWIASKIVCEDASNGSSGVFRLRSYEAPPMLVVKDHQNDETIPTYAVSEVARFPFRMVDEGVIAARNTVPGTSGEEIYKDTPCFLIQANFIQGGLILTFNGQHQAMDFVGQAELIRLLSKACRGVSFSEDELKVGNMSPQEILPLLGLGEYQQTMPEKPAVTSVPQAPEDASDTPKQTPAPTSSWAYFSFSPSALGALKQHATDTKSPSTPFVSTDDTLTAFIWQSIARVRKERYPGDAVCSTTRAVDVRRYFGIPAGYTGMMQNLNCHSMPMASLISAPLGLVASEMRSAVDTKTSTIKADAQKVLSDFSRAADKTAVSFVPKLDLDRDIMLSSWANQDFLSCDFGLGLGGPTAVRRPQFMHIEGLGYLLPKAKDGEVLLGICLRDEDIERLRGDALFTKYAESIL